MKLLSLLFACFVWLYVVNSAQIDVEKVVAVNYVLPPGFAIANSAHKNIYFSIRGPRGFIKTLQKRDETVEVNIEQVYEKNKKQYRFDVQSLGIDFPFGVELEKVEPNALEIEIEKKISKKVPIEPHFISEIPENFELINKNFKPSFIVISGAYSVIKNVSSSRWVCFRVSGAHLKNQAL